MLLINSQYSLPLSGGSSPSALPDETRDTLNTETYFPVFGLGCRFNLIWAVRKGALVWLKTERDLSESCEAAFFGVGQSKRGLVLDGSDENQIKPAGRASPTDRWTEQSLSSALQYQGFFISLPE